MTSRKVGVDTGIAVGADIGVAEGSSVGISVGASVGIEVGVGGTDVAVGGMGVALGDGEGDGVGSVTVCARVAVIGDVDVNAPAVVMLVDTAAERVAVIAAEGVNVPVAAMLVVTVSERVVVTPAVGVLVAVVAARTTGFILRFCFDVSVCCACAGVFIAKMAMIDTTAQPRSTSLADRFDIGFLLPVEQYLQRRLKINGCPSGGGC
jgi:hypothetical protein